MIPVLSEMTYCMHMWKVRQHLAHVVSLFFRGILYQNSCSWRFGFLKNKTKQKPKTNKKPHNQPKPKQLIDCSSRLWSFIKKINFYLSLFFKAFPSPSLHVLSYNSAINWFSNVNYVPRKKMEKKLLLLYAITQLPF